MQKTNSLSLKDCFIHEIEEQIISGELKAGDKLPSERELAASMNVSRAVVNAGLAEMVEKGFLIVKPRVGTFVVDYRCNGSLEAFASILRHHGGVLTNEEIRSLLEMRIILVNLAAMLTVKSASDEQLHQLLTHALELKQITDSKELIDANFQLYHELACFSSNVLLPLLYNSFRELACMLTGRWIEKYGIELLLSDTETFFQYVCQRDIASAARYIERSSKDAIDGSHTIYNPTDE